MFFVIKRNVMISVFLLFAAIFGISCAIKINTAQTVAASSKTVVIDPGHGGMDGGCVGNDDVLEKDLNLQVAKKLKQIFVSNGYNVVMTREEDVSLSDSENVSIKKQKNEDLKKRAEIANNSNAALFISVHMNKYEISDISGAQVFYSKGDEKGKEYSERIMSCLKKVDAKNKRLAKELPNKNLVFSKLKIPAVLVECGFLSNPEECAKLQEELYQTDIANAVYNGIVNCK